MIQIIGLACFAYIVYKRFLPMLHAERDLRLDWFGQWKRRRHRLAGTLHLLIFAGFLILATRAFYLLIFGLSGDFTAPAALGRMYNVVADYAATIVSLAVAFAAVRRIVFKPARYAVPERYGRGHSVDAIFLLGLTALLMFSESLFEATRAAIQVGILLPAWSRHSPAFNVQRLQFSSPPTGFTTLREFPEPQLAQVQ